MNPLLPVHVDTSLAGLRPDHILEAFPKLLHALQLAIETACSAEPAFDSRLRPLDDAIGAIMDAAGVVQLVDATSNRPDISEAWDAVRPNMVDAFSGLYSNRVLLEAIEGISPAALEPWQARLLKVLTDEMKRSGAALDDAGRRELQRLDRALDESTTTFRRNTSEATARWQLHLTDPARLDGLPRSVREGAARSAAAAGLSGHRLGLDMPTVSAVLRSCTDRDLRKEVWQAWNHRARDENRPLVGHIIQLRRQRATLLGRDSFTDLVTADRMAEDAAQVGTFLGTLSRRIRPAMHREHEAITERAEQPLKAWDYGFFSELLRIEQSLDSEAVRPFFPLSHVMEGLFTITGDVFGFRVEEVAPHGWHPDVRTFDIYDAGGPRLGRVHIDLFPRPGKRSGAWMSTLHTGPPHVGAICCNIRPGSERAEATLSHREVQTLFHEFGHLLHLMLSEVPCNMLAGTRVARDFVELPSQLLEEWTWSEAGLVRITRDPESGGPMAPEMIKALQQSRSFLSGTAFMRQLGFATMDLELHEDWDADTQEPVTFARDVMDRFVSYELPDDSAQICSFGHLFNGPVAYAGGYYVYKWAEVLSSDAFGAFEETSIFDRDTGTRLRKTIYAQGNAVDPLELFVAFRGREPDGALLLKRYGLG